MLDSIRRLFSGKPAGPDWREVSGWAKARRQVFKQVPDAEGFAIEGSYGSFDWRLEWGPPQRSYVATRELRIRGDLGLPPELQAMVISRSLLDRLERQTYAEFTQATQTYVGSDMPEEMRWVAMWAPVPLPGQRGLRKSVAVLGAHPEATAVWVDGALAAALLEAQSRLLAQQPPFILMCQRGRIYLRMELEQPDVDALAQAQHLHLVASRQAMRVAGREAEADAWTAAAAQPGRSGQG